MLPQQGTLLSLLVDTESRSQAKSDDWEQSAAIEIRLESENFVSILFKLY